MRGKNSLVMIPWFATSDTAPSDMMRENRFQGRSPARANSGYGTPSDGTLARIPNRSVNTPTWTAGCTIAHVMPNAACL